MPLEPQRKRRPALTAVVIAAPALAALLIASSVIDNAAPATDPIWYMVGAGVIVGAITGLAYAAVHKRR